MSTFRMLAIVATLAAGTSVAIAQSNTPNSPNGNPASNAAESGGAGTHQNAQKTGTAESNEKVIHNKSTRSARNYRSHRRRHHHTPE